jgi:hypothetical protein
MKSGKQDNGTSLNRPQQQFFKKREETSFFNNSVQAKLTVSQPNDPYEQEAEAMSEQVVQRLHTGTIQTKCAECEQQEKRQEKEQENPAVLLRKPAAEQDDPDATPALESKLASSRGVGSPLPADTNASMSTAMGADFSNVRIHTDGSSANMNRELNAQAFTHGSDIYFNQGKYDPNSESGQKLLAHELTHVIQQGAAGEQEPGKENNVQRKVNTVSNAAPPPPQIQLQQDNEPGFFAQAGSFLSDAASGLAGKVSDAASAVGDAAGAVANKVSGAISSISDMASGVLNGIRSRVTSGITSITQSWNNLKSLSNSLTNGLTELVGSAAGSITAPFSALLNAILNVDAGALSAAWNSVSGIAATVMAGIQQMISFVTGSLQQAWQVLTGLMSSVVDGIRNTIEGLRDTLGDSITQIIQDILSPLFALQSTIQDAWNSIMQFVTQTIQDVQSNVLSFLQNIINYPFGDFINRFQTLAKTYHGIRAIIDDPEVIIDPMAREIAPMLDSAPSKAAGIIGHQARQASPGGQPATGAVPNVQKQGAAPVRTGTGFVDFISGLERQLIAVFSDFDLIKVIKEALYTLINPFPGIAEDWENMKKELSDAVESIYWKWSIRDIWTVLVAHLANFIVIILRFIMSVLGRLSLYILIALTVGGAALGGFLGFLGGGALGGLGGAIFGAGFGAAPGVAAGGTAGLVGGGAFGAGAGFAAGLYVGEAILLAYIATEIFCVVQALLALTGLLTFKEKERYFRRIVMCAIGAAVGGLLIFLSLVGKAIAEGIGSAIGKVLSRIFSKETIEAFAQGVKAVPEGPLSKLLKGKKANPPGDEKPPTPLDDKPPTPVDDKPPTPVDDKPPTPKQDPEKIPTDDPDAPKPKEEPKKDPVVDPLQAARAALRARIAQIREHLGRISGQASEMPSHMKAKGELEAKLKTANEKLSGLESDVGQATTADDIKLLESELDDFTKNTVNPLQEQANAANVPVPTPGEQSLIDEYTELFRKLKSAQKTIDAGATGEVLQNAQAQKAKVVADMERIEGIANETHNKPNSDTSRLKDQIATMVNQKESILEGNTAFNPMGEAFPECEAVKVMQTARNNSQGNLRYEHIEQAVGRAPDNISGSTNTPEGAKGAVRLTWEFADGSSIHVDVPGKLNESPFAINRQPHAGIGAPSESPQFPGSSKSLPLSEKGVVVPGQSAPAHVPVQRDGLLNFRLKGRER